MSIIITSGAVRGESDVKQAINRAALRGIKKGILATLDEFLPTVAFMSDAQRKIRNRKDSGPHMRDAFEDAVDQIISRFAKNVGKRIITWTEIMRITINTVSYAKYHFRARGFYVAPSTINTKPMRFSSFKIRAVRNVNKEIRRSLKTSGLEAQARFNVS